MQKNKAISKRENYYFSKIRGVILFIYNYECVYCSYTNFRNHVHHFDKKHYNNDAFNLVCVCEICHKQAHKSVKFKKPLLNKKQVEMLEYLNIIRRYIAF